MVTSAHLTDATEYPLDVSAVQVATVDIDDAQGVRGIRGAHSQARDGNCRWRCETRGEFGIGGIYRWKVRDYVFMLVYKHMRWCIYIPLSSLSLCGLTDRALLRLSLSLSVFIAHAVPCRSSQPRRRFGRRSCPSCFTFSELDSRSSST